jgi:hypothetical protein
VQDLGHRPLVRRAFPDAQLQELDLNARLHV